ncbi:MAG: BACON domain-containing protein [Alistipes sp.]|nr:BACON domain-containing protein [Alistipes sp.]
MKRLFLFITALCALLNVACNNEPTPNTLTVTSPLEIVLGKFDTTTTITYTIGGKNDEFAEVTTMGEWIRVSNHKTSGRVVIDCEINNTGGTRMAAVTLSYGTSSSTVVLNQSAEATTPIITSLSGDTIELGRCGCKASIEYSLQNSNPVDLVYATTTAKWIYSIDTQTKGVVNLGVATNTTGESRSTVVTVGYGIASFDITLTQAGDGAIEFNATNLSGEYLGDALTPGAGNYWFILSDRGFDEEGKSLPNTTYYRIDAYGDVYDGSDNMVPIAPGTYTFDPNNTYARGTFTAEYSGFWVTNEDARRGDIAPFESGTLIVEANKITLEVVVDGQTHKVFYQGNTAIYDEQGSVVVYSTLDGDYEADLSNHSMIYECYGDYYEFGSYNWMFIITPNNGVGDCFQFDIITEYNDKESGFCGDYVASDYLAKNSFIPGWTNGVQLLCSWYFTADQSEMAPFRGGTMSVKDNGDGTVTVNINVTDDLRNTITATWTGTPIENK